MGWAETQHVFCQSMQDDTNRLQDAIVSEKGIATDQRLCIYRNNIMLSAVDALAETYRAVAQLVGEEYFEHLALGYWQSHPPQSGNMNAYGEAFATYIAQHEVSDDVPYLADVARFEWAWQQSFFAADASTLSLQAWFETHGEASFDAARFTFHPSLHAVQLECNAHDIWHFCVVEQGEGAPPTLEELPHSYVLYRAETKVHIVQVDASVYECIILLKQGETMAEAIEKTMQSEPDFAVELFLGMLLEYPLIESINHKEPL